MVIFQPRKKLFFALPENFDLSFLQLLMYANESESKKTTKQKLMSCNNKQKFILTKEI